MIVLTELTHLFNRKIVLIFLLTLAIFTSTGTLAYWSNGVQGTESSSSATFQIGSAKPSGSLTFTDTIPTTGYILPVADMIRFNNNETISFDVSWTTAETTSTGWTGQSSITSAIVAVDYSITVLVSGSPANDTQIQKILTVLVVSDDINNVYDLDLDNSQTSFHYTISFNPNMDRDVYNLLRRSEVTIQFNYTVTTN